MDYVAQWGVVGEKDLEGLMLLFQLFEEEVGLVFDVVANENYVVFVQVVVSLQ